MDAAAALLPWAQIGVVGSQAMVEGSARVRDDRIRVQVQRARGGDGDAFGELFRMLGPDVTRLCTRLLGNRDEADDAASEAFLRAQRSFEGYDPDQPFRRWLLAIAAHHCMDRLRRRAVEGRLFAPRDFVAEPTARGPTPLGGVLEAEQRALLLAALDTLPDRYRAPLVLRYFAELDYRAIAEILSVNSTQVGTLLFRARARLREQFRASLTEDLQ